MDSLNQELLKENLNTRFNLQLEAGQTLTLMLIECNDLNSTDVQEQFSLIFQGDGTHYLQQMIYSLTHEKLGEFSLFLVPIQKNGDGFQYEAIINRFRK